MRDDSDGAWIAIFCVGVLLTSLSATVCLGMIAFYAAKVESLQPALACTVVGAVLMIVAASLLDIRATLRTRARRRHLK
ncbi:MAG: hypothetical protein IT305_04575 [Chloroflexi bacterium]|nr:hypothetical protein [Chloroflexota bacterium]